MGAKSEGLGGISERKGRRRATAKLTGYCDPSYITLPLVPVLLVSFRDLHFWQIGNASGN
jgi:hypothetical protein